MPHSMVTSAARNSFPFIILFEFIYSFFSVV
jgi:hypothetical protein